MLTFQQITFTSGLKGDGIQVVRDGMVIDVTDLLGKSIGATVYEAKFVGLMDAPIWAAQYDLPVPPDPIILPPDNTPHQLNLTLYLPANDPNLKTLIGLGLVAP